MGAPDGIIAMFWSAMTFVIILSWFQPAYDKDFFKKRIELYERQGDVELAEFYKTQADSVKLALKKVSRLDELVIPLETQYEILYRDIKKMYPDNSDSPFKNLPWGPGF